jgi:hypothetical protein
MIGCSARECAEQTQLSWAELAIMHSGISLRPGDGLTGSNDGLDMANLNTEII